MQSLQGKYEPKKSSNDNIEPPRRMYRRSTDRKQSSDRDSSQDKGKKVDSKDLLMQNLHLKNPPTFVTNTMLQTNANNAKSVPQPVILDKFGNFRLITEKDVPEDILEQDRILNDKTKKGILFFFYFKDFGEKIIQIFSYDPCFSRNRFYFILNI